MNNRLAWVAFHFMTAAALGITGCANHATGDTEQAPQGGFGRVGVETSALGSGAFTSVVISSGDATATLLYDSDTKKYEGALALPAGSQTIIARAFNGTLEVARGSASVTVQANQTSVLSMRLLDFTTPQTATDAGPYIAWFTASSKSPLSGQAIQLHVNALDANNDPLTYAWSSSCGGTFSAQAADTNWQTDQVGPCTIGVTVTSRSLTDSASLQLVVFDPNAAKGGVAVDAEYIQKPSIQGFAIDQCIISYADTDSMCRTPVARLANGGSYPFHFAYTNYDPAGATVTVRDNCGGTFDETLSHYTPGTGLCTITIYVTDNSVDLGALFQGSIYVTP